MKTERDAFGHMLMAGLRGANEPEVIEREDGFVNTGWGASVYLAPYDEWPPVEQEAMPYVMTSAEGRIIAASLNPYGTTDPAHERAGALSGSLPPVLRCVDGLPAGVA